MIRYRRLGYVELMVSDLERSAAFYRDIVGLEPVGEGTEGERRFRCSEDPYAVVLHAADQPGFRRGGWMLEDGRQFESGMTLEYSFGMEQFPEVGARAPRRLEPTPANFDSWGSHRDPRLSTTGEIAAYTVTSAS